MYSVSEFAAKVAERRQESSLERGPVFPTSSVTLPTDVQFTHADYRLQITRTALLLSGCFE